MVHCPIMAALASIGLGLVLTLWSPAPAAPVAAGVSQEAAPAEPADPKLLDTLLPVPDGIVWYGTWKDAMAEMERTGKPVMLHMGSPRERNSCVPGTW